MSTHNIGFHHNKKNIILDIPPKCIDIFFYFSTKTYVVGIIKLEVPPRGASNEYPQHMLLCRNIDCVGV